MNCKICGSSEFCTNDGITYCTECQSQVETTQAEEAVELTYGRDFGSTSSGSKKAPTEKRKELYSDWITAECFNHILCMQVNALIELGVSQNLKRTVLHIWSKYLQKCEIAFRIDYKAKGGKPLLGPVPSKRDIKVLYGDKVISKRKRKLSDSLAESVKSEDCTSDSDCISEADSIKSEERWQRMYSSHSEKLLKKSKLKPGNKPRYTQQVFNMTIQKTLSICYLGLLYIEDQLSLLDLIRFIYEEKIPYLNILDKLPLKLQGRDYSKFLTYSVPDAYSILKVSYEIAKFLKLPEFKEPSVFLAVSRFVKEFNLPDDIKPIVKTLIERFKEQCSKFQNVPHDYQALAFIIVALKLLLVLDDKFEVEHSKVMKKLNSICEAGHKYFEWEEWKHQCMIKEFLFLCENPSYSTINKLDGLSADKIISKYPFTHLKSPTAEVLSGEVLIKKNNIKSLLSNLVNIPSFCGNRPTSFPLRSAVDCLVEEWNTLSIFKETHEIDFSLLIKDFSSCSLSFTPLQFDKDEDELSYLLMTSLYIPEGSVDFICKYRELLTCYQQVIRTSSNYWFRSCPVNPGKTLLASDWFEKLPNSFKWLINFISKYAFCNNIILYREVTKIEKLLFLQKKNVRPDILAKLKNKITIDF